MAELSFQSVTVTFNPAGIPNPDIPILTFSNREIVVPAGIGMITFHLETVGVSQSEGARFQTSPLQWLDPQNPEVPILDPHMFVLQRIGDWDLTLVDYNSVLGSSVTHLFNIVVVYQGQTYGSDPTIINEPEDG